MKLLNQFDQVKYRKKKKIKGSVALNDARDGFG
jgi:hypothetical protein